MNPRATARGGPLALVVAAALAASAGAACGKKGPPLPPLVRAPAPPGGFSAERVGGTVRIAFQTPAANTDGTRPANVSRVDVYAFTGDVALTDAQIPRYATRVGSVDVKGPRHPDDVIDPDEPPEDVEPLQGTGLDQGAAASLEERITTATYLLADRPPDARAPEPAPEAPRPLVVSAPPALMRTYVAVSVTRNGRPASFSARIPVPLSPPPPAPPPPSVHYDETAVTLEWPVRPVPPADESRLPSRWIGTPERSVAYVVYEVPAAGDAAPQKLTASPVTDGVYRDTRIEWGAERCYDVRAVETVSGVAVESRPSPSVCVTLTDTFPPPVPVGLTAVGTSGAINLIWEASAAPDLAGYRVLRGESADQLAPITRDLIPDTSYRDALPSGERRVYAVQAVDQAGNASAPSTPVEETSR